MFLRLTFNCVMLLLLLLLARSLEDAVIVEVGKNAYLPCSYTLPTPGKPVPVCWGKGPCPWSRCGSGVLSTDERIVTYQKSRRYQLRGNFLKGDVSLTIENVTIDDHGTYCCRVEFPGLGNDKKLDLKLVIIRAKFTQATSAHGDPTTTSPRTLTTEGNGSETDPAPKPRGIHPPHDLRSALRRCKTPAETQTLGTFYAKNRTISTWAADMKDSGETIRTAIFMGVGVSAGLALALIFGVLILKWYSYKKKKLQNSSLITLANLPPVGLANAGAGRNRSEENIYTIEENIYEIQNSNEYYCYANSGQPS